jgi:hypothetical protein
VRSSAADKVTRRSGVLFLEGGSCSARRARSPAPSPSPCAGALDALLEDGEIGEHELALKRADVPHRSGASGIRRIGEAAHDLDQRVGVAHLRQGRLVEDGRRARRRESRRTPPRAYVSSFFGEKISLSLSMRASGTLMGAEVRLAGVAVAADLGVEPRQGIETRSSCRSWGIRRFRSS